MKTIDITPNPRILEVITHNPMPPINALCELIDNSIDGFSAAKEMGLEINNPTIDIELPSRAEIESSIGRLVIRDNGPGLTKEEANDAIRAGFSGNEPIGRLGLFGMGFNISTGKLGKRTVFKTTKKVDSKIFCITIDIPQLVKGGKFNVPIEEETKPSQDYSCVEIEISGWWEEGTQNFNFIKKLVNIGVPKLTQQIGRRYSTLLRKKLIIRVNGRECPVFNHCIWNSNRFVERRGYGRIPARFNFNEVLRIEKRCYTCGNLIATNEENCNICGPNGKVKTRECSIKGWVGIQRFDDENRFGIDFIRNGRTILIDEKEAVFTWTPETTGEKIKEYPVDGIYGRIIGEVHIDHVPTDFLKTDFQRTSPEWAEVIKFLRGESSLLPNTQRQNNEPANESYIYKLFQGYRRVRTPGRTDMYIGYWSESKGRPSRDNIRNLEKELYDKFLKNEPGYGPKDDSGWWKHVEAADIRPAPEMKECPDCNTQCLKDVESCTGCGHIFISKKCAHCKKEIVQSAAQCIHCGANQIPEEEQEWICNSCLRRNPPDAYKCRRCDLPRGVEDNLKFEFLKENSDERSELSHESLSIRLPGNISMSAIKLTVSFIFRDIVLKRDDYWLPAVIHNTSNEMYIFIDQTHPVFKKFQVRPEDIISIEVAKWIWQNYQGRISDATRPLWSHSNLYYQIHSEVWGKRVELDPEEVSKEVQQFFHLMNESLPDLFKQDAASIYENMDDNEQSRVIEQIHKNNKMDLMQKLINNGEYLSFLPPEMVVNLLVKYPKRLFDGNFWKDHYEKLDIPDPITLQKIRKETAGKYQRCLEDMISFMEYRNPDTYYILKINQTLRMVRESLVYKMQVEW
ncbi:MAG: ATP-binding protein [Candidatus Peribacteraceae bacterium]|nr:ATP-binding protein [Candidatus Peribacteraceae bacterium]